jgi:hypothetical protein
VNSIYETCGVGGVKVQLHFLLEAKRVILKKVTVYIYFFNVLTFLKGFFNIPNVLY